MLTIITAPKAFRNHIAIIQHNAIGSWKQLHPDVEILLFGNEEGIEAASERHSVTWIPDVPTNSYGTPLLNFIFSEGQKNATHDLVCYVNADIILFPDLIDAVRRIHFPQFLLVGKRWNVDIREPVSFDNPRWREDILSMTRNSGILAPPYYIDCFVFPKGTVGQMPPFVVGRAGWDNWMIYSTRKRKIPVIDGTNAITLVHQNHDYSHISTRTSQDWEGPETESNRSLVGGIRYLWDIDDSDWKMDGEEVKKKLPGLQWMYRKMWRALK